MPDLAERLREFVDNAQPSVTLDEVADVVARDQLGSDLRQGRPRSLPAKVALLGCGAAALIAAVVAIGLNSVGTHRPPHAIAASSPAATVLRHAALVAESQQPLVPGAGQFLYVRLLDGSRSAIAFPSTASSRVLGRYYVKEVLEQWTSPSGPNRQASTVAGQPEFITGTDRALWEQAGSPSIESGYGTGEVPPYYDVAHLPTDPSKMSAYLASQTDIPVQTPTGKPDSLWDFYTAASFLENGASAQQRAALLDYMASIPGVTNVGPGTTLGTRLPGTVLGMPSTKPGYTVEIIIDPATSEVLEIRSVVSDPHLLASPTSEAIAAGRAVAPLQAGQAQQYQDFLYEGISKSSSAVPSDAPVSLPAWPYGTGSEPQAGSAY